MYIVLKSYLDDLDANEKRKPVEQRRRVPSMDELAHAVGIHPTTLSKIVNNNISQLSLATGGKIISTMRRFGFPMQETDLIRYQSEDS